MLVPYCQGRISVIIYFLIELTLECGAEFGQQFTYLIESTSKFGAEFVSTICNINVPMRWWLLVGEVVTCLIRKGEYSFLGEGKNEKELVFL